MSPPSMMMYESLSRNSHISFPSLLGSMGFFELDAPEANISFIDRGKGQNGLVGKAIYYFKAIWLIYMEARNFAPDILLSFASPYAALVSKLISKPHIVFNDTEHARLSHFLTDSFSKWILTPSCYNKKLGEKQIRFNGYMELCYLHPKYFTPDVSILDELELKKNESFFWWI